MKDFHEGWIEVRIKLPHSFDTRVVRLAIDEEMMACFKPLPRNREIPFETRAREHAVRQIRDRVTLTKHITGMLTQAVVEIVAGSDTVNGYTQEELQR